MRSSLRVQISFAAWLLLFFVTGTVYASNQDFTHSIQQPYVFLEQDNLYAADAQEGDVFGNSVAIFENTIVIAAINEDGGPGDPYIYSGAAYIFEKAGENTAEWVQTAKLIPQDIQEGDQFGISVAISGDTVVVGAYYEDGGPGDPLLQTGAAYVFERDLGGENNWGQSAKLMADDAQELDRFGYAVAIDGNTIVIGAINEDGGAGDPYFDSGTAYVFERISEGPSGWIQKAKLTAPYPDDHEQFGTSVGIHGDTIVVTAIYHEGDPGNPIQAAGGAFVFERNLGGPNQWQLSQEIMALDAQEGDRLGSSVAIWEDTIAVTARYENGGPGDALPEAGAAYLFERNAGGPEQWEQVQKLTASDAQTLDRFGNSVSIHQNTLVVGAANENGGPGDPLQYAGAGYVFEREQPGSQKWVEISRLAASDPEENGRFGRSVGFWNQTIVIGAIFTDGGPGGLTPDSGAAYVFSQILLENQAFLPAIFQSFFDRDGR